MLILFPPAPGLRGNYIGKIIAENSIIVPFDSYSHQPYCQYTNCIITGGSCVKIAYEEDADGIKEFENMKWEMDNDAIYDLSGRKYDKKPTTPGLYIMNGKKVVIR